MVFSKAEDTDLKHLCSCKYKQILWYMWLSKMFLCSSSRVYSLNHSFITRTNVFHWCYESTISKTVYVEITHLNFLSDSRPTILCRSTVVTANHLILASTENSWAQFTKSATFRALSNAFLGPEAVAYPGIFFFWGGGDSTNSAEDRAERPGIWGQ
jgi:hypothetical protein